MLASVSQRNRFVVRRMQDTHKPEFEEHVLRIREATGTSTRRRAHGHDVLSHTRQESGTLSCWLHALKTTTIVDFFTMVPPN
ncbi:hypothetical protein TNCV_4999761 [Trichonephila clavipes]|nr:hypothetical protein TNCV_4999761 [Trichonephila clavipes]